MKKDLKKRLKEKSADLALKIPALYLSFKDRRTPRLAKILALIAVAYALSPVDLIPDFIPAAGYLDDLVLLPALAACAIRRIPEEVWLENLALAKDMWKDGKPGRWYYAIPVFAVYALLIFFILRIIF
jgi:uncharacterized membrane protein YkvA (DUF1232 family)